MVTQSIRTGKFSKVIASYLAIQLVLQIVYPTAMWALTGGPKQPEFNSFTPIGTSDMVDLASGDFNYNIPIMDVGGYPLNLSYQSGVTMDQEASWVGLGWNLNVGQINRQVRGIPDDFKGDEMKYEHGLRRNVTIGSSFGLNAALFGKNSPFRANLGVAVDYNNYNGLSFRPSLGVTFAMNDNVTLGMNISSSSTEGASVSPSVSLAQKADETELGDVTLVSAGFGVGLNSRKGLENLSLNASIQKEFNIFGYLLESESKEGGVSGSISFNDQNNVTPSKRIGMHTRSGAFSGSVGGTFFGAQGKATISGNGSYQSIKDKEVNAAAFGYQHTDLSESQSNILDFTREKEGVVNRSTSLLPVTNYSYDIYALQGQGIGGQFRPFRSQVGFVNDPLVSDSSSNLSLGVDLGLGNLSYTGVESKNTSTKVRSSVWQSKNDALEHFKETPGTSPAYEKVYFKNVGELHVDDELDVLNDNLAGEAPINFEIVGSKWQRRLNSKYKIDNGAQSTIVNNAIARDSRLLRNQNIQVFTQKEAYEDFLIEEREDDDFVKPHHTVGMKIHKTDGSVYVFGNSLFNKQKIEATFDVSGSGNIDCTKGLVGYNGSTNNNSADGRSNEFLNKITTPAYAHTFLLTSILSSDYQDLGEEGLTKDDLGTYTKFTYESPYDYKWRVPFSNNKASYNEGLKSNPYDQTGNYIYGTKEVKYLKEIETKTHIAVFETSVRNDGYGVEGENGGIGASSYMKQLDKIYLFSLPEYNEMINEGISRDEINKRAIKTAHFKYNNSLCQGIPNSINSGGKLTLEKVFFTYRNSEMGRYNPYIFEYDNSYNYNLKAYDIWGNYKENNSTGCSLNSALSPQEFPFVDQESNQQNNFTSAWSLKAINLPSGGRIQLETESDDYQYVQDQRAMQMFKVYGVGNNNSGGGFSQTLRNNNFVYIKITDDILTGDNLLNAKNTFKAKYLNNITEDPIYFRFLLNMTNKSFQYDYVEGYCELDAFDLNFNVFTKNSGEYTGTYAALKIKTLDREAGVYGNRDEVNAISRTGWHFGRTYLNKIVSGDGDTRVDDLESAIRELLLAMGNVSELITGPNKKLQDKGCANKFKPGKSWVRLFEPNRKKYGGGLRVKKLEMLDRWDQISNQDAIYSQKYGQEYSYTLDDGSSSGVASYEPNSSKENPLVKPFFAKAARSYAEKIASPKGTNYKEAPVGEAFYPSSKVTYSKVAVKNLERTASSRSVKSHATGKVVSEFFTTRDFPTISRYTKVDLEFDPTTKVPDFFKIVSKDHMTLSQGFSIITNDMDGKMKSQFVYPEGSNEPISGVSYEYNVNTTNPKRLDNKLVCIDEKGQVSDDNSIGVDYDVVNDFVENYSETHVPGINKNITSFLVALFTGIVPMPLPTYAKHENILRMATTTKVIYKRGILKKKIAYDLGATVETENMAWDANTGQVLVTKTQNEFDDNYYNITYPAYWYYEGMGLASENIGVKGRLNPRTTKYFNSSELEFLKVGDELKTNLSSNRNVDVDQDGVVERVDQSKLWVVEKNSLGVVLMTSKGYVLNLNCNDFQVNHAFNFEIVRSGKRNQQTATMASVTTKSNPIVPEGDGYRNLQVASNVVNASVVEYSDFWEAPKEEKLPQLANNSSIQNAAQPTADSYGYNPYRYNVKGNYRAIESYAFLASRSNFNQSNLATAGTISNFEPFYKKEGNRWVIDKDKWTAASKITQYHPNGNEIENKDALGRYSSAQYGYNNTLPIAVASNSAYNEMAFDGFEDYLLNPVPNRINYRKKHLDIPYFVENLDAGNFEITEETSHSGRNSLKVLPNKKVSINRGIGGCSPPTITDDNCYEPIQGFRIINFSDRVDCDGTSNPRISGSFLITGEPYALVEMEADIYGSGSLGDENQYTTTALIELPNQAPYRFGSFTQQSPPHKNPNISTFVGNADILFYLDGNGELPINYSLSVTSASNNNGDNPIGELRFLIRQSTGFPNYLNGFRQLSVVPFRQCNL